MIVCLFEFEQLGWSGGSSLPFFFFVRLLGTPIEQQWPQNLALA
ncbi:unnamed protein product, partial [Brassica oleracea var. botrytis]